MHKESLNLEKIFFTNPGQLNLAALIFFVGLIIFSLVIAVNIQKLSPLIIAGIISALAVGVITLIDTNFGLMILIFSMLLSPEIPLGAASAQKEIVVRFDDFMLIAVFFTWLAKMAMGKEIGLLHSTPLNGPILIYLAANIFSTVLGILTERVDPKISFFYILKYVEFFMIYFLFVNNLSSMKQLKTFIFCFLLTSFIIGIYTYTQMGSMERPSAPFEGVHKEPNTLGGYLLFCLSITLGLFLIRSFSFTKNILAALFCFNLYALLMTLSRSAYIGFIFSYIYFMFLSKKRRLFLGTIFVFSILLVPLIAPKSTVDRIAYTFQGKKTVGSSLGLEINIDDSAAARVESWSYVLENLARRPFFGFGVTGLGLIDSQFARSLGELGFIGFLSLVWLILAVLRHCWRIYHTVEDEFSLGLTLGFLCGFIGLLIMGFGASVFVIVRISEPLWFLAACVISLPEIEKIKEAPQDLEERLVY